MTEEEYKILKERLQKGKEYLRREYWNINGGKGRRDTETLKLVDLWFHMWEKVHTHEHDKKTNKTTD